MFPELFIIRCDDWLFRIKYNHVCVQQYLQEETVISMDSVIFESRPMPIGRYHLQEMACNEIGKLDLCENCS